MNPLFTDWHLDIAITLPGEVLLAREKAADEVVAALTAERILDLVAVSHQRPDPATDLTWFREAFKGADPTFRMRDNDRELAVLAAACLVEVCGLTNDRAVLAASASAVASRRGWTSLVADLATTAEQRLLDLGAARRQHTPMPTVSKRNFWPNGVPDEIATELAEGGSGYTTPTAVFSALGQLATAANMASDRATRQLAKVTSWVNTSLRRTEEETDLMGWLLCGSSETLGLPWSAMDEGTAAIVAGQELARRALFVPAPPHSDALLDQLLAATPFAARPQAIVPPLLTVPGELGFLIAHLSAGENSANELARLSLRQTILIRVWSELE